MINVYTKLCVSSPRNLEYKPCVLMAENSNVCKNLKKEMHAFYYDVKCFNCSNVLIWASSIIP